MTSRRPSRRAAQRSTQAAAAAHAAQATLTTELESILGAYSPAGVGDRVWVTVRPTHLAVMRASHIVGAASFRKHLGVVAKYLTYRCQNGLSLDIAVAFSATQIDHYYLHGLTGASERTRNDYRSRLVNIAKRVNRTASAPVTAPPLGHRSVRPGYTAVEEAAVRRTALRQHSPLRRRQLCAIVGLCAGAGLSPTDLRHLTASHVIDHGDDGIEVRITHGSPRVVWVRRSYEDMVRIGLEGVAASQLVIGEQADRRNITAGILARADLYDAPPLDASRLRSTWLTWLLTNPVPIAVIMRAAGLKTARSLTELVADLTDTDIDTVTGAGDGIVLREGGQ